MSKRIECHECGRKKFKYQMYEVEVYDSPWDEVPKTIYVCKEMPEPFKKYYGMTYRESCEELLTDTSWAAFRYFTCDACQRMVISQCPSNGWHSYMRIVNECEQICLKCYEEDLYENGIPRESFEQNKIAGMFFNRGDLQEHGYEPVEGYQGFFVRGTEDAKKFCAKAIELIASGHKVAVDYERMAIGGLEGYVNLYTKPSADKTVDKLTELMFEVAQNLK